MRLFVALWPPEDVLDRLEGIDRPADTSVRWTAREQWHVTLRFLGEVGDDDVPALVDALGHVGATCSRRVVELGPATRRLGRGALVVPVHGLDDLAAAVLRATGSIGQVAEHRSFSAHVTLGRGRHHRPLARGLEGRPVEARWHAAEITLVRSHLGDGLARYEILARSALR